VRVGLKMRAFTKCSIVLLSAAGLASAGDLRLLDAVKSRDQNTVRALLQKGADVNVSEADGATALHWAAYRDDLETVDALLRAGTNVNAANELGVTPLSIACTNRNAAMVARLLAAGANSNATLSTGESVLMTCARTGSAEAVKALLAHGAKVNVSESSRKQTALMWAVAQRHPDVVKLLLEHGADVHARSAVTSEVVVREETGARVPCTAPNAPKRCANVDTTPRGGSTALLFAARQGDVESARLLVAAGANVNDTAADGTSALVMAAHSGHGTLATFLLDKDASPNAAGSGYAALHAALLRGDEGLVKALLSHGANPNAQITKGTPIIRSGQDFILPDNLVGATPFLLAAKFIDVDAMRALASAGADTRLAAKDGTTPLMAAAGLGWGALLDRRGVTLSIGTSTPDDESRAFEAVKVALDLGADVKAATRDGDTAMHAAASKGYNRVIELLLEHGADLNVRNARRQTPLTMTADAREGGVNGAPVLKVTRDLLVKLGAKE
jgi:ankyrin repeat protein